MFQLFFLCSEQLFFLFGPTIPLSAVNPWRENSWPSIRHTVDFLQKNQDKYLLCTSNKWSFKKSICCTKRCLLSLVSSVHTAFVFIYCISDLHLYVFIFFSILHYSLPLRCASLTSQNISLKQDAFPACILVHLNECSNSQICQSITTTQFVLSCNNSTRSLRTG